MRETRSLDLERKDFAKLQAPRYEIIRVPLPNFYVLVIFS